MKLSSLRESDLTQTAIFGSADGLGIVLGLVAGLIVSHQPGHAVWAAAVSSGVAEFFSMANGQRLSEHSSGWRKPLVIGLASFLGCVLPAIPYSLGAGTAALVASLTLSFLVAGIISWARPERGALAITETYVLLIVTAVACVLAGLLI